MVILDFSSFVGYWKIHLPNAKHNEACRSLRHQMSGNSVGYENPREMGMDAAIGNSCQLIRNADPRKPSLNKLITELEGTLIHSRDRWLECCVERSRGQLSDPKLQLTCHLCLQVNPCRQKPAFHSKQWSEIGFLETYKSAWPDGTPISFFKDVDKVVTSELTKLLGPT